MSHNDKSASVTLNIVPATGVKISITSLADPITIGDKKQLTVSAQSGSYDNILWSSSNTNLVRVDANGVARAVGYTSSTVGATESASGSHTGKINIYNGTGTAVITAVARDASNKEVARASVNVNTTTAAQTAYNSGSNAQNYFNFGAKFADKFLMGQTAGAATNAQLANMGFTVVTPGAGMKPQDHLGNNVRFSNGVKNSSNATWYSFNSTNGVKLHGHVLLWHQWNSIGQWFKDVGLQGKEVSQNGTAEAKQAYRDEAILNLEAYIKYIVEHYNSSTASWDVVNEAFTGNHSNKHWSEPASGTPGWWRYLRQDDETSDAALHPAPWWWAIGPEYVWYAFLFARQYTTEGTTLYYNDYGMDEDLSKVTQVIAMMNDLNARYETYKADHPGAKPGKLIDGVGMQQHLNRASNPDNVKTALDRYRTAGVKVVISELTVLPYNYSTEYHANRFYDSSGNAYCHFEKLPNYSGHDASEPGVLSARYQMDQALMYARAMRIYADYADVIDRVSIFGLNSGIGSWRPFSLPFDNSSRAKPAVYAIMNYADFTEDHPSGSLSAQWPVNSVTGY